MATPRKNPEDKQQPGRKTEYREEYCERLIYHMEKGNSFWSFGAIVDVSFETLSNWCDAHPEFLEAKKIGLAKLLFHDETNARKGVLGKLKRIAKVIEVEDTDPETGETTVKRRTEYAPALFNGAYMKHLMNNRYPDIYRNKVEVESRDGDLDLTEEQRKARIDELLKKRASSGTK